MKNLKNNHRNSSRKNIAKNLSNDGNVVISMGNFSEKRAYYLLQIKKLDDAADHFYHAAYIRKMEGEYQRARELLEEAWSLRPWDENWIKEVNCLSDPKYIRQLEEERKIREANLPQ